MKHQSGYTLIELLVVTSIISLLAAVAIPQFYPFKTRAYDTDAKSNLRNVFQSCKGYWVFNSSFSPCLLSTVSNNEYGFVQSPTVEITIESNANNTESDFAASASHIWSSNVFMIDNRGLITSTSGGGGEGNNVNDGVSGESGKEAEKEKKKKEKEAEKEKKKKEKEAEKRRRKRKRGREEKKKKEKEAEKEKKKKEKEAEKEKKGKK